MADRLLQRGFRVGAHRVEPMTGRILGPGGARHVQPKVMDVLLCLARHAGQVVERDAIVEEVWRRATSEEVLTRCISELRRALDDERGTPRYIQTVPKRGYRLVADVDTAEVDHSGADASTAPTQASAPVRRAQPVSAVPETAKERLRFLLVDDHALFREGLKLQLLELDESILCIEAGSCEEAIVHAGSPIDMILLDYGLPGARGLDAIAQIRAAFSAPITVVSAIEDPLTIREAIVSGAMGYIPKTMAKKELFAALGVVRAGGIYLPPQALFGAARPGPPRHLDPLQRDVLRAALQGRSAGTIAAELGVSEHQVEAWLYRAFRALGVDNRTDALYEVARNSAVLE